MLAAMMQVFLWPYAPATLRPVLTEFIALLLTLISGTDLAYGTETSMWY